MRSCVESSTLSPVGETNRAPECWEWGGSAEGGRTPADADADAWGDVDRDASDVTRSSTADAPCVCVCPHTRVSAPCIHRPS
ncbi:hypothetical protein FOA52_006657 [Chlamydomonas sp. UWO 241]|nr:hypothetical protein FOA52_006657 [Chlamydomonas sp. UWO 241]